MSKANVFILGASGLVGSECVKLFLQKNCYVHGFARNIYKLEEAQDCTFHSLDVLTQGETLFELIKKHQPKALIFAIGNHGDKESIESSKDQFSIHFDFVNKLLNQVKDGGIEISIVFCSSLMAHVPDRLYPSYAASKAGLNQFIQSSIPNMGKKIKISGLVLGPISANPKKWFELSVPEVAQSIFKVIIHGRTGLIYLPFYGKVIALLSIIMPFQLEKILLNKRRPNVK